MCVCCPEKRINCSFRIYHDNLICLHVNRIHYHRHRHQTTQFTTINVVEFGPFFVLQNFAIDFNLCLWLYDSPSLSSSCAHRRRRCYRRLYSVPVGFSLLLFCCCHFSVGSFRSSLLSARFISKSVAFASLFHSGQTLLESIIYPNSKWWMILNACLTLDSSPCVGIHLPNEIPFSSGIAGIYHVRRVYVPQCQVDL